MTYSGFVNGETPNVLGGQLTFTGPGTTATEEGTYQVSASGLTSNNYVITYVNGTLAIDRRILRESAEVARLPVIPVRRFVETVPVVPVCQPVLYVSAMSLPDDPQRSFTSASAVCSAQ